MNNNPNQNRQRPVRPHNGDPRQLNKRPRGNPPQARQNRRPVQPVQNRPVQRNPQPRRSGDGLSRVVIIWIAVLAVLLVLILIIAGLKNENDPGTLPAGANTAASEITTTEETTETDPVDHSDYTDDTKTFAGDLSFTNGILIDVESGTVLASRGGDSRIYPASMTKIMTLIVAAEAVDNLDETFTMTAEITDPLYVAGASCAGFLVGEEVTVRDLIYGLILPSGGDGALGLAYHIAGSEAAFAEMMNEKARELGLTNTHFTNCTGLHDDDHYSTCHEIAMILEYAIQDEFMREVLTAYQYTTESTPEHPEGILLTSTLLSRMSGDESSSMFVQGGKTGYTLEAKNCLASFATELIPGLSEDELKTRPAKYILVTVGSGEKFGPVFDAISVYGDFYEAQTAADGTEAPAVTGGIASEPDVTEDTEKPENTKQTEKTEETEKTETEAEETASETVPIKIYTAAVPS